MTKYKKWTLQNIKKRQIINKWFWINWVTIMNRNTRTFGQTSLWMPQWRRFWMRWTSDSTIHWQSTARLLSSTTSGTLPINWRYEQDKKTDPPGRKKGIFLPWLSWAGQSIIFFFFLSLDSNWNISFSWILMLQGPQRGKAFSVANSAC
jgi:hypothetical protein